MSRSTNAITNKHQKHPKVHFQQYLYNSGEPSDNMGYNISPEDKTKLEGRADSYYMVMRRQIRRNAQRLRTRYS